MRAKFVLEVKCIECDESEEQEPLKIFKAVGLPRRYVDVFMDGFLLAVNIYITFHLLRYSSTKPWRVSDGQEMEI